MVMVCFTFPTKKHRTTNTIKTQKQDTKTKTRTTERQTRMMVVVGGWVGGWVGDMMALPHLYLMRDLEIFHERHPL
jgi:hypothetical protein